MSTVVNTVNKQHENLFWYAVKEENVYYLKARDIGRIKNWRTVYHAILMCLIIIIFSTIFGLFAGDDNYFIVSLLSSIVGLITIGYIYDAYLSPLVEMFYVNRSNAGDSYDDVRTTARIMNLSRTFDEQKFQLLYEQLNSEASFEAKKINHNFFNSLNYDTSNENHSSYSEVNPTASALKKIDDVINIDEVSTNEKSKLPVLNAYHLDLMSRDDITIDEYEKLGFDFNNSVDTTPVVRKFNHNRDLIAKDLEKSKSFNQTLKEHCKNFNGVIIYSDDAKNTINLIKSLMREFKYMNTSNRHEFLNLFEEVLVTFDIMDSSGVGTPQNTLDRDLWERNFVLIGEKLTILSVEHHNELELRLREQYDRLDSIEVLGQ